MTQNSTSTADTATPAELAKARQVAAVGHRLTLIADRTAEIAAAEAEIVWDGPWLARLYAARGALILEALDLGVVPSYIAMVTGVGGSHVGGNIVGTH